MDKPTQSNNHQPAPETLISPGAVCAVRSAALIDSFERNHPDTHSAISRQQLLDVAKKIYANDPAELKYLTDRSLRYERVSVEANERSNFQNSLEPFEVKNQKNAQAKERRAVLAISRKTNPLNEESLSEAISRIDRLDISNNLKRHYFESVRIKVPFGKRSVYLNLVAEIANLDIYPKLHELADCKKVWGSSSTTLDVLIRDISKRLIRFHSSELITHDHFSSYIVSQVADLSGLSIVELSIIATEVFAETKPQLPAQIWLGLASTINAEAKAGEAQAALHRLLNSGAAKLSSMAVDGIYRANLYVMESGEATCAHLIWQGLGSEWARCRWRAAHTVRIAAKMGSWKVIDTLLDCWRSVSAGPYQAEELKFYHHHAKLWMLIALARVAIDHPREILKHKAFLTRVAIGKEGTHVMQQQFAALALLLCADRQPGELSIAEITILKKVGTSTFSPVKDPKTLTDSFYQSKPTALFKRADRFHLDYDFAKYDATTVGNAFGKNHWEIGDEISRWVRGQDTGVKSMGDHGGRYEDRNERYVGMSSEHHGYGQYLGWHGLHEVAGEYLKTYPTVVNTYGEDRWSTWYSDQTLSCANGLWLSDGLDRLPVDILSNLVEADSSEKKLTSNKNIILTLLGIIDEIANELVVCGNWKSADDIDVRISSALLPSSESETVAKKLAEADPFFVSLPFFDEESPDPATGRGRKYGAAWIRQPTVTLKIDQTDPWGSVSALERPQFSEPIQTRFSLRTTDYFNRSWVDKNDAKVATGEAWGCHSHIERENRINGERLLCSGEFLKRVLKAQKSDLLLLIVLRRYDKGPSGEQNKYWHTTAVVQVRKSLAFSFIPGASNQFHEQTY